MLNACENQFEILSENIHLRYVVEIVWNGKIGGMEKFERYGMGEIRFVRYHIVLRVCVDVLYWTSDYEIAVFVDASNTYQSYIDELNQTKWECDDDKESGIWIGRLKV